MAGHAVDQRWRLAAAEVVRQRTARMEGTARRWIDRARNFAGDLPVGSPRRRDVRNGLEQHARIGMARRTEHLSAGTELHDAAEIHDANPVRHVLTTAKLWLMKR